MAAQRPAGGSAAQEAEPIHMLVGPTVVNGRLRGGFSKGVRTTLEARLPAATRRPIVMDPAAGVASMSLAEIIHWTTNASFIVCEEGSFLVFLAFARPGTTWVAVAEFSSSYHLDPMRFHLRTWLLNPTQRLIFLVTEADNEHLAQDRADTFNRLFNEELARPYVDSVVLIRSSGTIRCDSYFSCATLWDPTLVLDPHAAVERPPALRD